VCHVRFQSEYVAQRCSRFDDVRSPNLSLRESGQKITTASSARYPRHRGAPGGMLLIGVVGSSNLDARSATDRRLVMQKQFDYRASGRAV
jgi:hypothetical protein